MDLDRSRVERKGFDLDAYNLFHLQLLEDAIQNAALGPAIHACINAVPVTKSRRKTAPFAALLGHIQYGVEHFEVLKLHIPALNRQAVFNLFVLRSGDFHCSNNNRLVLTRPSLTQVAFLTTLAMDSAVDELYGFTD